MISVIKTYSWFLVLILPLSNLITQQTPHKTISHEITLSHPGEEKPVKVILNEFQNEYGLPFQYAMDVYSVICLEEVCKIIPVKLYWNNLGEYQKYELVEGATLEKYKADLFEAEDYIKIQNIMANPNSPFKDVYYNEILTVPDEHGNEDVDAVSGATALELDEKDTVPGAALTCYTLWHWANGDVVAKIKQQTGKSSSVDQLKNFILNDNNKYFNIAINELQNRGIYTKPIVESVIAKVLKDETIVRPALQYLNSASSQTYLWAVERILKDGDSAQKIAALQSLRSTNHAKSKIYLEQISELLSQLSTYQEVALMLGLMEDENLNSQTVHENVLTLLKQDFLLARRAYWFLKNQELNAEQDLIIRSFEKENKSRL